MIIRWAPAVVALLVAITMKPAVAQDWPTRPISLVVPGAGGGPIDVIGRILAPRMSEILGRQVIVEAVPGAGGMTAAARVARAAPDGYHVLLGAGGVLAQNQTLYKHPLYNSTTDFAPVGLIALAPPILVTRINFPASNLTEFIAYAKQNQDTIQFGSAGPGSGPHITCLLLNLATGITATHVAYRGSAPVYQDLIAGRIDYMCDFISTALPQIEGKQVKAIATLTRERTPVLPDLATADEQGVANFDAPGWYALVLPAGTAQAIMQRLNEAMSDALDSPVVQTHLKDLGNTIALPQQRTPQYLAAFIRSEIAKWAVPIRASGVSLE
jgi:tripartite-type tricarboxylate transporter receptor subunit TctC